MGNCRESNIIVLRRTQKYNVEWIRNCRDCHRGGVALLNIGKASCTEQYRRRKGNHQQRRKAEVKESWNSEWSGVDFQEGKCEERNDKMLHFKLTIPVSIHQCLCLLICWDLRVKQWFQDIYWLLTWRSLFRLTYLFQTTHTLQLPSLYLIKQGINISLTGLDCINCLNLCIYHSDRFLHWTTRRS